MPQICLSSTMLNALGQQCLPSMGLGTTSCLCANKRGVALCFQPPSSIPPPETHLLNQTNPTRYTIERPRESYTAVLVRTPTLVVTCWDPALLNQKLGPTNKISFHAWVFSWSISSCRTEERYPAHKTESDKTGAEIISLQKQQ